MKTFSFDAKLFATLTIKAASRAEAEATIRDVFDGALCNGGAWPDGSPILFEAYLDGDLDFVSDSRET